MTTTRPMRADAQRNRERLVEVAVLAFSEGGADVPLEAIAKDAGVGIGTLYRHFPTREALVEATYRNELARVSDVADALLAAAAPDVALRTWMLQLLEYFATKRALADALRALIASGANPYEHSRARMVAAATTLLDAGVSAGTIRTGVQPLDVVTSLHGISLVATDPEQTDRLVDLLMAGLRPSTR